MVNQRSVLSGERSPLSEACITVLDLLVNSQKSYSITGIARDSGLHRQTVSKCVDLIVSLEKLMDEYRVMLDNVDDRKIVSVQRRTGLLSYPEHIQRLIIKLKHFPEPSRESRQILYFYLKKATSSRTSKLVEGNEVIEKLLKQGQLKKTKDGRIYLSDEGIIIAKGFIKTYPEVGAELTTNSERNNMTIWPKSPVLFHKSR